jgi:SAM-dependent methyltransferase
MHNPLNPDFFQRLDDQADEVFYRPPRLVKHIDEPACAALSAFYKDILPRGGKVLDLMSSWVSHLPEGQNYDQVVIQGMNATELAANEQATSALVFNLNSQPSLPFADGVFDGCVIAVSIQYLTQPKEVFAEIGRVLKPGAPLAIAYSNRMFPTKAVAIWRSVGDEQRAQLINWYFEEAGLFDERSFHHISPNPGQSDPLYVVMGRRLEDDA